MTDKCVPIAVVLLKVKLMCSRYRPGVAQRLGRGIALLFHDRGTRRGWVVSSMHRPHFNPGKDTVPILQEAGWAPGSVWKGGKSRPHRNSIPDPPARSQSLHRLSYPAYCSCSITRRKIAARVSDNKPTHCQPIIYYVRGQKGQGILCVPALLLILV